jgi:hypothetical protein
MSEDKKVKDVWDKIQIATTFIGTILIGLAGILFTFFYNQRQLDQSKIAADAQLKLQNLQYSAGLHQADAQVKIQKVQLQTAQVQAMTQLTPYLASKDKDTKKVAYSILRSIDSTSLFLLQDTSIILNNNKRVVAKTGTVYGTLLIILTQINENKNLAINPQLPYDKRVKAFSNIYQVINDKKNSKTARDSAAATIDQIRKSPNTPLVGIGFTVADFKQYLDTLQLKGWKPSFFVLHNTTIPSLQGLPNGFSESGIVNLINFYTKVQGWKGAPHLIIDDKKIWVMNALIKPGIHSPSWNKSSLGIVMLGDYDTEELNTGRGKEVLENTIAAIAFLEKKFGINPDSIKFHKEDPKTTHSNCPGKNVEKEMIITESKKYVSLKLSPN